MAGARGQGQFFRNDPAAGRLLSLMGGRSMEFARMKTLPALLLSTAAVLALSSAAFAQTPAVTPPAATPPTSAPPPGEGVKPGSVPKGQQPPVIDPAEVPPTQGDTVAPPASAPPAVDPSAPAGPATPRVTPPVASTTPAIPATPANPGVSPATRATPASPATGGTTLVNGASVKDAQGNVIGTIDKVGTGSAAGQVTLKVDGKSVTIAQSVLSETGGAVVSAQTKAELLAQIDTKGKKDKKN
ncbi:MAG: hypothetical protein JWR84_2240 [Caulobacter sp.]|nr:hypothetical protein [Caulobacter sp.]